MLGNYQQAWYVGIIDKNVTVWPEHALQLGPLALKWYDVPSAVPWYDTIFARYFVNTIFVATAVLVGVLATSVLAAYAFARMDFFGKNVIFILFLATMMIPFEVTMIPNFVIIRNIPFNTPALPVFGYDLFGEPGKAGWYNTYAAQIVPWLASVFTIFMLRQFFLGIPQDFYDAARIDGCGHLRFLWQDRRAALQAGPGHRRPDDLPGELELAALADPGHRQGGPAAHPGRALLLPGAGEHRLQPAHGRRHHGHPAHRRALLSSGSGTLSRALPRRASRVERTPGGRSFREDAVPPSAICIQGRDPNGPRNSEGGDRPVYRDLDSVWHSWGVCSRGRVQPDSPWNGN